MAVARPGEWLTTSAGFQLASERGWGGTLTTFRRRLADGTIPDDLRAIGLVEADFAARAANPKDNRTRWLRFE